jgi:hypothetical protein
VLGVLAKTRVIFSATQNYDVIVDTFCELEMQLCSNEILLTLIVLPSG